jgi:putrescine transport system ATP-binding protein
VATVRGRPDPKRKVEPWEDPQAQPFIRIANLTRTYGSVYAVDNVSLDIYRGEFFALLGPSGCGKSTLLRMLAGFEQPTSGRIEIDGTDMATVPPWRRPVNMMFQSYAIFPHLTVEQNIAFGLKREGLPRAEIRERVEQALEFLQLEPMARRKPDQISGGQRQRVALARAIVKRPKVLLLDEPLGALDRKLREKAQFELVGIQERLGITFVIVTHDQEEAMTVATRIAVMREGQIAQVGTPAEIYELPSSRFVADFLGDVNMIEGRVASVDERGITIDSPGLGTTVRVDRSMAAAPGQTVWAAIRPEKLIIGKEAPPAGDGGNAVSGTVWDIGYLGDVSVYHVKLDSGAVLHATAANRRRLVERPITWEDRVWLSWEPDAAVVLKG